MDAGVRNYLSGRIEEVKSDQIMSQVTMRLGEGANAPRITSVMTTESLNDSGFKEGDNVDALIKAINVVFVKH